MTYSIRDLLLMTAVIAVAVGWYCDHRRLMRENEHLRIRSEWVLIASPPYGGIGTRHLESPEGALPVAVDASSPSRINVPPKHTAPMLINEMQAIGIVRRRVQADSPDTVHADYSVSRTSSGFSVLVIFGSGRAPDGSLIGMYPGGHVFYEISHDGEILNIVGGA